LCCHLNSFCVVFRAQMWVSTSYFVSALLNARCSSSFCKTFHVSFNLYSTWTVDRTVGVYQWCADLQIPCPWNSASVGFVEKWVPANDMHCTCARRTGLLFHGLFLGETHSASASQVYMRYEALIHGPFAPAEKKLWIRVRGRLRPQSAGHWRSE